MDAGRSPLEHMVGDESVQGVVQRGVAPAVGDVDAGLVVPQVLNDPGEH